MPRSGSRPWLVSLMLAALLATSMAARAEIYRGIQPGTTLSELRRAFPGAEFRRLRPAWAKEADVMYKITGNGLPGTTVVMLRDARPYYRLLIETATIAAVLSLAREHVELSDEDAWAVELVRWLPEAPFPVERLIAKYGKWDKKDYGDEDMAPYVQWVGRGLVVELSNDEMYVLRIDYEFTDAERKIYARARDLRRKYLEWKRQSSARPTPMPRSD